MLFAEISRTTTQKERTSAFTVVIAISELGLIVGPALNLFLRNLDYKVGPFVLDKYTSPGVRPRKNLVLCILLGYLGTVGCDLDNSGANIFVFLLRVASSR